MQNESSDGGSAPALLQGKFEGPNEFADLIRLAFAHAAQAGWRELVISDASFSDWPLGERVVIESLSAWAQRGRKLTMLAKNYDEIIRRHPRFATWRTTWSHLIECRGCPKADPMEVPSMLIGSGWMLHRFDTLRSVGVAGSEPARRVSAAEELREWLDRKSTPAFASSTLGL